MIEKTKQERNLVSYVRNYNNFNKLNDTHLKQLKKFASLDNAIIEKVLNGENLNKQELKFLYGLFKITKYFDYNNFNVCLSSIKENHQTKCKKIIKMRNVKEDLSYIYNCNQNEIATSLIELIKNNSKILYGNMYIDNLTELSIFSNLEIIIGNLYVSPNLNSLNLPNLKEIWGEINAHNIKSINLTNIKLVDGDLDLDNLSSAQNIKNLNYVGGDIRLYNLISAQGLENLKLVVGSFFTPTNENFIESSTIYMKNLQYTYWIDKHIKPKTKQAIKTQTIEKKATLERLKQTLCAFFPIPEKISTHKQLIKH